MVEKIKAIVKECGWIGAMQALAEKKFSLEEEKELERLGIVDDQGRVRMSLLLALV